MRLDGASAIVTGAASGMGAATAAALARQGTRVFGLDRAPALEAATPIADVTYRACDVADAEEVRAAVAAATSASPLRLAVNCAGVAPSTRILGRDGVHDLDLYARVIQVNLIGSFHVLTLAAEAMARTEPDAEGQRGLVVNTASIAAYEGQIGQAAYASSKGGIVGLTLPAARDLARFGIRVNTIAPGVVETPMLATVTDEFRAGLIAGVPFPRRLARPEEFADLVLAIVAHDYLNGEVIRMDGGLRMTAR